MSISKILGATMAAEARMQRQHGPHTLSLNPPFWGGVSGVLGSGSLGGSG
jgi:hypothetical protein